jgi:hypothetical protein
VQEREPTEEQLRDAWRAIAQPGWGEYDHAKAAWLHFSLARARARLVASGRHPAPPSYWGSLRVTHTEPLHDRKRAAVGERDDD